MEKMSDRKEDIIDELLGIGDIVERMEISDRESNDVLAEHKVHQVKIPVKDYSIISNSSP
jgi:hypothetical protein